MKLCVKIITLITVCLLVSSCSSNKKKLLGTWEFEDNNPRSEMTFLSDGTVNVIEWFMGGSRQHSGRWEFSSDNMLKLYDKDMLVGEFDINFITDYRMEWVEKYEGRIGKKSMLVKIR